MFGDVNHSPVSVLASEQLSRDGEPARGAMLAFSWAAWLREQTGLRVLRQNKCPLSRRRGNEPPEPPRRPESREQPAARRQAALRDNGRPVGRACFIFLLFCSWTVRHSPTSAL